MSKVRIKVPFSGYIPLIGRGPINFPFLVPKRNYDIACAMGYGRHMVLVEKENVDEPSAPDTKTVSTSSTTSSTTSPSSDTTKEPVKEPVSEPVKEPEPKLVTVKVNGQTKQVTEEEAARLKKQQEQKKTSK